MCIPYNRFKGIKMIIFHKWYILYIVIVKLLYLDHVQVDCVRNRWAIVPTIAIHTTMLSVQPRGMQSVIGQ